VILASPFVALQAWILIHRDPTAYRLIRDEAFREEFVAREFPLGISREELESKLGTMGRSGFYYEEERTLYSKWIADPGVGGYLIHFKSMMLLEFRFDEAGTLVEVVADDAYTGP